jgi:hypothetical protein
MREDNKPTNEKRSTTSKKPTKDMKQKNGIAFKTNPVKCSVRTIHVPTPGPTVWATWSNFLGAYKKNPSSGWSHLICHLHSIEELIAGLEEAGLQKKIAHLALVGHNEAPWLGLRAEGTVTFDPSIPGSEPVPQRGLRPSYLPPQPTPAKTFEKLEPYLLPDAMLSLYVCKSAAGTEGDRLLKDVSLLLPGRTIVGFTVFVVVGGDSGSFDSPGNAAGTTFCEDGKSDPELQPLTPWGKAAKRARDGEIIHVPWMEKKGTMRRVLLANGTHADIEGPPYRCANDCCLGHDSKDHDCEGW